MVTKNFLYYLGTNIIFADYTNILYTTKSGKKLCYRWKRHNRFNFNLDCVH